MDELGTADLDGEGRALPGSGTIKLSEIKTEFGRGNNLRDYYGVASGIPSSGIIKVTDFYGKSSGPITYPPYGNYGTGGPPLKESWRDDPAGLTVFMDSVPGTGQGTPLSFPDTAGAVGSSIYGAYDEVPGWLLFVGPSTSSDVTAFKKYRRIAVRVDGQSQIYYTGSNWELRSFDGWNYACYVQPEVGAVIRDALDRNRPFYLSLSN